MLKFCNKSKWLKRWKFQFIGKIKKYSSFSYGENLWGKFTKKICWENLREKFARKICEKNLRGKIVGKMPCLINQENRLKCGSPAFDQLQFLWQAFQISFGQEKLMRNDIINNNWIDAKYHQMAFWSVLVHLMEILQE